MALCVGYRRTHICYPQNVTALPLPLAQSRTRGRVFRICQPAEEQDRCLVKNLAPLPFNPLDKLKAVEMPGNGA